MLQAPCSYQGGKQRLAKDIVDIIYKEEEINGETHFFDLCCGSGTITIELLNRGILPENISMYDVGCFGNFWNSVANKEFDLQYFKKRIDSLPDKPYIQDYLKELSKKPVSEKTFIYDYLLLQAGAFGSKQIWIEENCWMNCSFRSLWLPTTTSNRRSVVNPMMPMPDALYKRVEEIVNKCNGKIWATCNYAESALFEIDSLTNTNAVVYIDPPYKGTTKYGFGFNPYEFVLQCWTNIPIYVSEGYSMNDNKKSWLISSGRNKGNISGEIKKKPNEEWLNKY